LCNESDTSKSFVDSLQNTAQALWKPSSKVIVNPEPSAICTRTQIKIVENFIFEVDK
jgi:hypothetical protein